LYLPAPLLAQVLQSQLLNKSPIAEINDVSFDVMEEGTPCDYCGQPVGFMDEDEVMCPTCRAEYSNMD
jgi:Zn finger protein HypA/HybF involved in hydrogenase expression